MANDNGTGYLIIIVYYFQVKIYSLNIHNSYYLDVIMNTSLISQDALLLNVSKSNKPQVNFQESIDRENIKSESFITLVLGFPFDIVDYLDMVCLFPGYCSLLYQLIIRRCKRF